MATKRLKDQIQKQVNELTTKLNDAQASLTYWQSMVKDHEAEIQKLQGALASLEGRPPVFTQNDFFASPILQHSEGTKIISAAKPKQIAPGSRLEMVDGVEYEIPDGFEIGKNSFGETAILPSGQFLPAMEEPAKPAPVAGSLPPVSPSEGFDKPEDLF